MKYIYSAYSKPSIIQIHLEKTTSELTKNPEYQKF